MEFRQRPSKTSYAGSSPVMDISWVGGPAATTGDCKSPTIETTKVRVLPYPVKFAVYPNGQEQHWKCWKLNGLVGSTPMYGAMAGKSERFRECLESTSW